MATLTITVIQTNIHWENKPANLQMLQEKIRGIGERTEVIVLPEMFSTGFSMKPAQLAETTDGETVRWMKRIASENKVILTGSLIISENARYYNRLIWAQPDGMVFHYDKRHRFAFAGEDKHYTAGNKRIIASVKGWKINLQVCYDLRFPVWSRQSLHRLSGNNLKSPEYDLLLYVANWPERRIQPWRMLLQARAIENQSYVVGVNRVGDDGNGIYHSGDSMIVDPMGEILYHCRDKEDVFTISLDKEKLDIIREKLPFWRDGDDFSIHT